MRLDKYLSIFKIGTRSEIHKIIKNKKIKVNDEVITKPDYQVNEENDQVKYNEQILIYENNHNFFNQPKCEIVDEIKNQYFDVKGYKISI